MWTRGSDTAKEYAESIRRVADVAGIDHVGIGTDMPAGVARTKAHAVFGLLNSTPHIATNQPADGTRRVLETMAICALLGTSDPVSSEGSPAGR